jgi:hypothetical protein
MEFYVPTPKGEAGVDCRPEKADQIEELHQRVAGRIMQLIRANGGLYIKLGFA